jgi:hypothetical protein
MKDANMNITPAIFYIPHQDDEAIGMAGAIQEQKQAGRPVFLVLLTNGADDDLLKIYNGQTFCEWHQTYHKMSLTMEQLMWARKVEFIASSQRLGADKIFILENGQGLDVMESFTHYDRFVNQIVTILKSFEEKFPGSSHKLISGSLDLLPDGSTNSAHRACWDAAQIVRNSISDFTFYRIYAYYQLIQARNSQFQLNLKPEWQTTKQAAIDEYKLFLPEAGRLAAGYHCIPQLLDGAYNDPKEYFDLLP